MCSAKSFSVSFFSLRFDGDGAGFWLRKDVESSAIILNSGMPARMKMKIVSGLERKRLAGR
jgi:hypothetical protein